MKKFFSLFVTAAVALFGLTCCGGGGGDSELDPQIKKFVSGAKKCVIGNKMELTITPSGNIIHSSGSSATVVCNLKAGNDEECWASVTMSKLSETSYLLTYAFQDYAQLSEAALITAFGFTPIENNNGDSVMMPDSIASLASVDIETTLDFDTENAEEGSARTVGSYNTVDETGFVLPEKGQIVGATKRFYMLAN